MKLFALGFGLVAVAWADMQIFVDHANDPIGGGTGHGVLVYPTGIGATCGNRPPRKILSSDASSRGAACDGCDLNNGDANAWDITRFELFDSPGPSGNRATTREQYGSLTAFGEGGGSYGLNVPDLGRIGRCERVTGDWVTCADGIGSSEFIHIMNCYGETAPITVDF